jgi:hypothetical protein
MTAPADPDVYLQEVEDIADGFQYEDCESCGGDFDDHFIAPDILGHAHAWCVQRGTP